MTRLLTAADVVALHRLVAERLDGVAAPPRDEAALIEASARARTVAFQGADPIRLAALAGCAVVVPRPFAHANAETALVALGALLRLNGLAFAGDWDELADLMGELRARFSDPEYAAAALDDWLRPRVRAEHANP